MELQNFFQGLAERLQSSAHVKTVYGEPIALDGKTVVPVAKIAYGLGGGSGNRKKGEPDSEEGGGGGAGVSATPVGVVEITAQQTRFIPFGQTQKLVFALFAGFLLGRLLWRRRD